MRIQRAELMRAILFTLAVFLVLFFIVKPAHANGPKPSIPQQNNASASAGSTLTDHSAVRALSLSSALGDVDIGDCVITTQHSILIAAKQDYEINPFCEALALLRVGFTDAAVLKFCRDTSVGEMYPDEQSCLAVMVIEEPQVCEAPDSIIVEQQAAHEAEDDDRITQLEQRLDDEASARKRAAAKSRADRQQLAQKYLEQLPGPDDDEDPQ